MKTWKQFKSESSKNKLINNKIMISEMVFVYVEATRGFVVICVQISLLLIILCVFL